MPGEQENAESSNQANLPALQAEIERLSEAVRCLVNKQDEMAEAMLIFQERQNMIINHLACLKQTAEQMQQMQSSQDLNRLPSTIVLRLGGQSESSPEELMVEQVRLSSTEASALVEFYKVLQIQTDLQTPARQRKEFLEINRPFLMHIYDRLCTLILGDFPTTLPNPMAGIVPQKKPRRRKR